MNTKRMAVAVWLLAAAAPAAAAEALAQLRAAAGMEDGDEPPVPAVPAENPSRPRGLHKVYRHEKAKVTLTLHVRAYPGGTRLGLDLQALSYEGPLGHFLLAQEDIERPCCKLAYDDGARHGHYRLGYTGLLWDGGSTDRRLWDWDKLEAAAKVEEIVEELTGNFGKRGASEEFAADIAALRERLTALEEGLAQNEARVPSRLRTGDFLSEHGRVKQRITEASRILSRLEAVRAEVEPALGELMDPDNSNPKATFYWGMRDNTRRIAGYLDGAQTALDVLSRYR